ncbi:MAG: hypothetical protein ABR587_05610 [Candidatus Binatia bacterium]
MRDRPATFTRPAGRRQARRFTRKRRDNHCEELLGFLEEHEHQRITRAA